MDKMSLGYLVIDHNKAIKGSWVPDENNQMENVKWSSFSGQGRGNSNTEKNNDNDGLKYKTSFLDGIPKGAGFPFVFARINSIFMKKWLIKVKNQAYSLPSF